VTRAGTALKEEDNNKKGLLLWLLSGRAQRQGDQITFGEWVSCRKKKKKEGGAVGASKQEKPRR
jgi:hypothetical protein